LKLSRWTAARIGGEELELGPQQPQIVAPTHPTTATNGTIHELPASSDIDAQSSIMWYHLVARTILNYDIAYRWYHSPSSFSGPIRFSQWLWTISP
jgi:hypothetical protein